MPEHQTLHFGPYRLDLRNAQLWRGKQAVRLTAKAVAVLQYLVARPGQLVTKDELLSRVWPEAVVSDPALTVCMGRLRKALRDSAKKPQYIETVHRQGYRFIGKVGNSQDTGDRSPLPAAPDTTGATDHRQPTTALVGRETELTQLHQWLDKAINGERQVVFVTGEAGIGKTTLVEAFLEQLSGRADLWIARGQCIKHHGAGEAYLPVLEAVGQLCREPGREELIELVGRYAPTWLAQIPGVLAGEELEALQRRVVGATKERMLREMAEAIELLTAERTLVLRFEDLQWSDYSSLDLISYLARRPHRARVLLLGAYRPVDVILGTHPLRELKQDLLVHGQCQELALELLTEDEVAQYVGGRFPTETADQVSLGKLARYIYRRTEGNPLFMVNVVDNLVRRGMIVEREGRWGLSSELEAVETPGTLRQFIEQQVEQLTPEAQRALEMASVAGMEFSTAAVSAALEKQIETVENECEELARQGQFVRALGIGEWPDGTITARFGFTHALYQEVLYERLRATERINLHQKIGKRIEEAYGPRAGEIAAELAVHFEQGRDFLHAVQYLQRAAENAVHKHAYPETIALLTRGLALLQYLPDTSARWRQEFALHMRLSPVLMATKGYAAPEVEATLTKTLALSRQIGDDRHLLQVLLALSGFYMTRGELEKARACEEQCLEIGTKRQSAGALLWSHYLLGATLIWLGEFGAARTHLEEATAVYCCQPPDPSTFRGVDDPGVGCHLDVGLVLWFLGYPDQALRKSRDALALAHQLAYPMSLASALHFTGVLHELRGEGEIVQERAEALMALVTEHGTSPHRLGGGRILYGWALAEQGDSENGLAQIYHGLTIWESTGSGTLRPYALAVLAEVYQKMGQSEKGLAAVKDALALVNTNAERWYEAELYRLRGELTLQPQFKAQSSKCKVAAPRSLRPDAQGEAEACFLKAIEVAQRQQAKSLELRATISLARLKQAQGNKQQARTILAEVYNWFTEGFDTADLKEARALLDELS
ncbi:MAG: AAA family ATPase [Candidatus Binatia bacterium]